MLTLHICGCHSNGLCHTLRTVVSITQSPVALVHTLHGVSVPKAAAPTLESSLTGEVGCVLSPRRGSVGRVLSDSKAVSMSALRSAEAKISSSFVVKQLNRRVK